MSKETASIANVEQEIYAGIQLNHPNIAKYHTHFHDQENFYIVYDYIQGKKKFKIIQTDKLGNDLITCMTERSYEPFNEIESRNIFKQLVDAVSYCHSQQIVHFDIKLDNIMYNEDTGKVTLLDFGLSDCIVDGEDSFTKRVGSNEYHAPELLQSRIQSFSGTKVDIWTLGVVFFTLLTARFPLTKQKREDVVRGKGLELTYGDQPVSIVARDLVSKMLDPNPDTRITMSEVISHPFFEI